jgi:hypothetical protein
MAGSKIFVDLVTDCLQLTLLELANADATPTFDGADERGVDELQDGASAKGMRDDFGCASDRP